MKIRQCRPSPFKLRVLRARTTALGQARSTSANAKGAGAYSTTGASSSPEVAQSMFTTEKSGCHNTGFVWYATCLSLSGFALGSPGSPGSVSYDKLGVLRNGSEQSPLKRLQKMRSPTSTNPAKYGYLVSRIPMQTPDSGQKVQFGSFRWYPNPTTT